MVSSPPSRLTPLQRELLLAFFEREQRFFLTGGAALAGFYLGHRTTEDLDLFSSQLPDLLEASRLAEDAATSCGATITSLRTHPSFRRLLAARGEERCVIDLVADSAKVIDPEKTVFGLVRVDTIREIAANKVCAVLGRSEIKDLVDLKALSTYGVDLEQALADASRKDAGVEPATLAWVLDQISISPSAPMPGGVNPVEIDGFRKDLVRRLRTMAFEQARGNQTPWSGLCREDAVFLSAGAMNCALACNGLRSPGPALCLDRRKRHSLIIASL